MDIPAHHEPSPGKPLSASPPVPEPGRPNPPQPLQAAPNDSIVGFLLLGLFLSLPGVLIAWITGRDGHGWEHGGRVAAWIGALLSPFVWLAIIIVFTVLFTGSVTMLGCLMPGADCLAQ